MQNTQVSQLGQLLQVGVQRRRVEQDGRLSGGLLQGLGQVLQHSLLGILVEQRIMLHDQEAVVVLIQDGHELEDGENAAHIQGGEVAIKPTEDARACSCKSIARANSFAKYISTSCRAVRGKN
jgi:hypothetical protein